MKVEYKGQEITYSERDDLWESDMHWAGCVSLKAAKKKIDDFHKKESGFKSMPCIIREWGSTKAYQKAIITSVDSNGDFWVNVGGERKKMPRVFADTEENLDLISKIYEAQSQAKKISAAIREFENAMVLVDNKFATDEVKP